MKIRKATPIFVVDAIGSETIAFWEKTGWTKRAEVPHEGATGFVLFEQDGRELMLQTRASVKKDLGKGLDPSFAFYMDVESLEDARAEAERAGARIVIRERETFYGARECWVVEPGGTLVGYAKIK
ncbi:MAG TPA: VOC family protein [Polyangiaceae bacterium]|jgi:uncharacterized glyoxalase superfamily protein PhnB